jgi:hypothetical protein
MDSDISTPVGLAEFVGLLSPHRVVIMECCFRTWLAASWRSCLYILWRNFPIKFGNTYALVCIGAFTKFVWIFPILEVSTASTIRALNSLFATFGIPEVLASDNAAQFTSRNVSRLCLARGIWHVTTTPYYPQSSHTEQINRNLRAALIACHHQDHSRWDDNLASFYLHLTWHITILVRPFHWAKFPFTPNSRSPNLRSIKGYFLTIQLLTPYMSCGMRCVVISASHSLGCTGIMMDIMRLHRFKWEPAFGSITTPLARQ